MFGFVCHPFAQLRHQRIGIAVVQIGAQIVCHPAKQTQVHLALRRNAQTVAVFTEILAVGRDKTDAAGKIAVAVFTRRTGIGITRQQLPAFAQQTLFQAACRQVLCGKQGMVVTRLHQLDKTQRQRTAAHILQSIGKGLFCVFAQ